MPERHTYRDLGAPMADHSMTPLGKCATRPACLLAEYGNSLV
jgi:hypothetical protein